MLIHLHKVSIDGKSVSGGVVLNTQFMSEIVVSGTGAAFKYFPQPMDRRGRTEEWVVSETVAQIRTAMGTGWSTNVAILDHYDTPMEPLTTQRVFVLNAEIVKIYPDARNRNRSWVLVSKGGAKVSRYLVNQYYLDFVQIAETGSTSTTTSTTSTSSTSSTSTTSTSTTSSTSSSTTTTVP